MGWLDIELYRAESSWPMTLSSSCCANWEKLCVGHQCSLVFILANESSFVL